MKEAENKRHTLLIDNSNTRTKFALSEGGRICSDIACLPTASLTPESIRSLLSGKNWVYTRTVISSVVPVAASIISEAVGGEVELLSASSSMNIELDYPGLATLGADRLANAMAAAAIAPLPCVAVDFGTATTFDVIVKEDGRPRFIGGVIAPGLGAMGQYLARNTALLPALEPQRPEHAIGRCTQEALHAGSHYGYCGLVRGILQALAEELGEQPHVVATGGDAALLASWMPEINSVRPLLTFEGLALLAGERN